MTKIEIHDSIAQQLANLARQSNTSVDALLQLLIQNYVRSNVAHVESTHADDEDFPGSSIKLARAAESWGFSSDDPDMVTNSRKILNEEFADYLLSRMDDDAE